MTYLPTRARLLDIDAEVLTTACTEYEKYAQLGDGFHDGEYSREHEHDLAHGIAEIASAFAGRVHSYVELDARAHGHAAILETVKSELGFNAHGGGSHELVDLANDVIYRLVRDYLPSGSVLRTVLAVPEPMED